LESTHEIILFFLGLARTSAKTLFEKHPSLFFGFFFKRWLSLPDYAVRDAVT